MDKNDLFEQFPGIKANADAFNKSKERIDRIEAFIKTIDLSNKAILQELRKLVSNLEKK